MNYKQGLRECDPSIDAVVAKWVKENDKEHCMQLMFQCNQHSTAFEHNLLTIAYCAVEKDLSTSLSPSEVKAVRILFQQHKAAIFLVLGHYSLPYCYQSAAGARTLYHSRRLLTDPIARLRETGEYVEHLVSNAGEKPFFEALARVRLLHSIIRALARSPFVANQTEMVGTGLSFSLIMLRGLRRLGKSISPSQAEAWLRFWGHISIGLGASSQLVPTTLANAWQTEQTIKELTFSPSQEAQELTQALTQAMQTLADGPLYNPSALMAFFLGSKAASALGISTLPCSAAKAIASEKLLQFRLFANG